jgi:3-oxoadipate enol-lactonase
MTSAARAAARHHDSWARLPAIACPVMVMGGCYIARPEGGAGLAGRIPGAQLRFFGGGHLFMLEDGDAWPAMIEFLGV